ncbi:hypothetical protein GCM10009111_34070 [Colwellia asteriadis]|uniref:Ubiquinone biosynthesis accessory factor UbiJ n=1 Tax=Colwellia asteriadis TaxID=517723 RepID=A0ABP3WLI4_9GAMM
MSQISQQLLLPQVLSAVIEYIVNKALSLSTNKVALNTLNESTLTVHLAELKFPLSFSVCSNLQASQSEHKSIIVGSTTERSDCTIYTSIQTLKKINAEQQITQLIKAGELDVEGDIKIAQQFATIAQQLDIDWQSEIAKHIGDVPTHKAVQFGNKITKKMKATNKSVESDIVEYLVHEKRLIVTKGQLSQFNQSVIATAQQVNTLSERMEKLEKTLASANNDAPVK